MTILLFQPQSVIFAFAPASGTRNLTFGQFDPALGTLTSVIISLSASLGGTDQVENLQVTPAQVSGSMRGTILLLGPSGGFLETVSPTATQSAIVAAYDGTIDAAGASGAVLNLQSSPLVATSTLNVAGGYLGAFIGTGGVNLPVEAVALNSAVTGGGNLYSQIHVTDAGTVTLQYAYIPPVVVTGNSGGFSGGTFLSSGTNTFTGSTVGSQPTRLLGAIIATTDVQAAIIADQTTNWTKSVSFTKFDPSLGKLDNVVITVIGDVTTSMTVANLGLAGNFSGSIVASINLASYANLGLVSASPVVTFAGSLAAMGGVGSSLVRQVGTSARVTQSIYQDSDLAVFTGPGTIDLTASANATGAVSGLSDFSATLAALAGAEIDISYIYEPGVLNPVRSQPAAAQSQTAACFAFGTRILTDQGERAIETITVGDRVITHRGDSVEVVWCGRRTVVPSRHPEPGALHPVRITAGAFGSGIPRRDFLVSPDHAIFVDGVLIPAACLINGVSIFQHPAARITWHHIELIPTRIIVDP